MRSRYYLGIDPDLTKNGIALWDSWKSEFIFVISVPFWNLIQFMETQKLSYNGKLIAHVEDLEESGFEVVLEAGWLIKASNWHRNVAGYPQRAKQSKDIGQNHGVGKMIAEYLEFRKIKHRLTKPLGTKGIKSNQFRNITGWQGRTNEDNRDAAMLVFKT